MSLGFHASVCRLSAELGQRQDECLPEDSFLPRFCSISQSGFTLIELLAVIVLLAIVATITTMAIADVGEQAERDLVHVEMVELRKALLQFKRDVGHFPDSEGTFLQEENDDETNLGPFRLRLLWDCQALDDTIPLENPRKYSYDNGCKLFSADLRRGWNGPYVLQESTEYQPEAHANPIILSGMFDPWTKPNHISHYRLLEPEDDEPGHGYARIVSFGPNGKYESESATDKCVPEGDDVVLCLVR